MKRLYFLSQSIDSSTSFTGESHQYGIQACQIYVVGKNHPGLIKNHLYKASVLQTPDILPALMGQHRGLQPCY